MTRLREQIVTELCRFCGGTGDLVEGKCPLYQCEVMQWEADQILTLIAERGRSKKNPWENKTAQIYKDRSMGFEYFRQSLLADLEVEE